MCSGALKIFLKAKRKLYLIQCSELLGNHMMGADPLTIFLQAKGILYLIRLIGLKEGYHGNNCICYNVNPVLVLEHYLLFLYY